MNKIEGNCREVCEATEWMAMVTMGDSGPHLVGQWGDYIRALGFEENRILFPMGQYRRTEENLGKNSRVWLLASSRKVQGTRSMGQAYLIEGSARVVGAGEMFDRVKAKFPWARAAMVIDVEEVRPQL